MELLLLKTNAGLIPCDDEGKEFIAKKKLGATLHADVTEVRNGALFRKWWSMVKYAYDHWNEVVGAVEYNGVAVKPAFERFRKDVTILAGYFEPVVNINGELRLEASSLKWAKMTEETFELLYSATLKVLIEKVFNGQLAPKYEPHELRAVMDGLEAYG